MSNSKQSAVRSEFLFCYDARMSNPNGDPDENRPRIDPLTKRNLVTDFRLKRTIRDYLSRNLKQTIFIRAEEDKKGNLKRIEDLGEPYIKDDKVDQARLLRDHIDIRLFGVLFAVSGVTFKRVGPIQFAIGQSLNPVEEIPIRMSRIVPTKEEAQAGTFGEKFILRYSFIVFHGFLNSMAAKDDLTEEDVSLMLKAMWHGTNNLSTTSKYGQQSRLLLRLRYKEPLGYIGDLDRRLKLLPAPNSSSTDLSEVEDLSQIILDTTSLNSTIESNSSVLSNIDYWESSELVCKNDTMFGRFSEVCTKKVSSSPLS
ncbi:MAG: type I-B CRISPR-associated protein Cas7/Csh2 [Nitrososphaerales archaeon]